MPPPEKKTAMRESEIEKKLKAATESRGGWCLKIPSIYITGLPDRLCLLPGARLIFVEVKKPGAKPRLIQIKMIERLNKLGFATAVLDNVNDIQNILDHAK